MYYRYDPAGNRSLKVKGNHENELITWYVRDASGNVMATYEKDVFNHAPIQQKEVPLYGSARLGMRKFFEERNMEDPPFPTSYLRQRGKRYYEQSNHLGNVLTTVTDQKRGKPDATGWAAEYYDAQVASATDYYPFGQEMPGSLNPENGEIMGRSYMSSSYRYGFNGKEKDQNQELGDLTHYDYGFRIYNPAVGRFLSVDPLAGNYPWYTPYQFAGNKPIFAVDLDGLEETAYTMYLDKVFSNPKTALKYHEDMKPLRPFVIGATLGLATVSTGGLILKAPGVQVIFWRGALWLSNPTNQAVAAEVGTIAAAAIDPNPAAQYSAGAEDELGNAIGQGIRYLFRGTSSKAFEGGAQMVRAGVTPTSHNPFVSVLYGIYNKTKYGKGTLLIGKTDELIGIEIITGINQLKHDREIALEMLPSEFAKIAQEVKLEDAADILKKMGFELPTSVRNLSELDAALKEAPDLTIEQITKFVDEVKKLND